MKKTMLALTAAALTALLLFSCGKTPYVPKGTAADSAVQTEKHPLPYTWTESAVSTGSVPLFSTVSRGFAFVDNGGRMTVYNPAADTASAMCYDPLCTHGLESDCNFRYAVFGSVPVQMGDRLYWFDTEKDLMNPDRIDERHYRICTSDLWGQEMKILYRNGGNTICGMAVSDEKIVFTEQVGDQQILLHSMTLDGKKLEIQPCGEDEILCVDDFALLHDRIYYTAGAALYSCAGDFTDVRLITEKVGSPLAADAVSGHVYYVYDNTVRQYNPETGTITDLFTPEEGMRMSSIHVTDGGFAFFVFAEGITSGLPYEEYTKYIDENDRNILCHLSFADGKITETPIPDGLYFIQYAIKGTLLVGNRIGADEYDGHIEGDGWFVWDMESGDWRIFME